MPVYLPYGQGRASGGELSAGSYTPAAERPYILINHVLCQYKQGFGGYRQPKMEQGALWGGAITGALRVGLGCTHFTPSIADAMW